MQTGSLATVVLAIALAISTSTPARADVTSIKDVIMGGVPTSIVPKDLTPDWRTFSLNESASAMSPFSMGGTGSRYYTKGEHIKIGNDTFLIAYRMHVDILAEMQNPIVGYTPKMDSTLSLALVNLSVVDGIVDLQPFDPASLKAAPSPSSLSIAVPESEIITTEATPDDVVTTVSPHHTADDHRLGKLWKLIDKYVGDHQGRYPPMKSTIAAQAALTSYTSDKSVFYQVDTKLAYLPNPNMSQKAAGYITYVGDVILFYTQKPDMCGCHHALYADGEAHEILPGDWKQAKKFNHLP